MGTVTRYAILAAPVATGGPLLDLIEHLPIEPQPLKLTKRAQFFLEEIIAAGPGGITSIAYPGVRVGDAVHKLRKAGVIVETQYEQHRGEFAGTHGRYVLRSKVVRLPDLQASRPAGTAKLEGRAHV